MNISFEQLHTAIEAEIAEMGEDYIYTQPDNQQFTICRYEYDGKPSCLIGRALYRLGYPIQDLKKFDDYGDIQCLVDEGLVDMDSYTTEFVLIVQQAQDNGMPWGEALHYADREI